jgi:hypothetical protein
MDQFIVKTGSSNGADMIYETNTGDVNGIHF